MLVQITAVYCHAQCREATAVCVQETAKHLAAHQWGMFSSQPKGVIVTHMVFTGSLQPMHGRSGRTNAARRCCGHIQSPLP